MKQLYARHIVTLTAAWLVLLGIVSCATAPETGRRQLMLISASEEMQLGLSEFESMKRSVPVSNDPEINALVQRVGKRIAAVAPLPDAQWEFVVFESPEANAFCLPGGKVGVYTGILPITKDETGMATVIGHEVAHAAAHHGAERVSRAILRQTGAQLADQLAGQYLGGQQGQYVAAVNTAYGLGTTLFEALPHSRTQESEADQLGLIYMARAGYDPEAAIAFWQRFAEYSERSGGGTVWFLRTHPLDEQRIEDLRRWMPQAKQQYRPMRP
jgi:predicted Zn-dependent protease